ncbi:MAG: antitoxin [Propionibacteriaceae bacterium]|jgi:hypothetical protein|nr:antitoxin [Propionibacteriaceae bacterium]
MDLEDIKEGAEDLLGKGKDLLAGQAGNADGAIDAVEDFLDNQTGHKFTEQIDGATDAVRQALGGQAD